MQGFEEANWCCTKQTDALTRKLVREERPCFSSQLQGWAYNFIGLKNPKWHPGLIQCLFFGFGLGGGDNKHWSDLLCSSFEILEFRSVSVRHLIMHTSLFTHGCLLERNELFLTTLWFSRTARTDRNYSNWPGPTGWHRRWYGICQEHFIKAGDFWISFWGFESAANVSL